MREQFWGFLWSTSVDALGPKHPLSRRLESKWCEAYWASQPALNPSVCSAECKARHG